MVAKWGPDKGNEGVSPRVANFCLRKTAQLHQEEFDKEVIETVNRDMYIDDMMKSTSTTEKAISLASQLRTLLEMFCDIVT